MNTRNIPPFTPRPALQITRLSKNQYKRLERRVLFSFPLSPRHPPNMSNPRCARIRIWWNDIRKRRRQTARIKALTLEVNALIAESEANITLFYNVARLHNIQVNARLAGSLKRPFSRHSHHSSNSSISSDLSARSPKRRNANRIWNPSTIANM
jgi:hypothetical protein